MLTLLWILTYWGGWGVRSGMEVAVHPQHDIPMLKKKKNLQCLSSAWLWCQAAAQILLILTTRSQYWQSASKYDWNMKHGSTLKSDMAWFDATPMVNSKASFQQVRLPHHGPAGWSGAPCRWPLWVRSSVNLVWKKAAGHFVLMHVWFDSSNRGF